MPSSPKQKREWYLRNRDRLLAKERARYAANRPKMLAEQKRRNDARREDIRRYHRNLRGCPEPTRPMPAACECCGAPLTKKALCVDHDHATGKFRGWICQRCNSVLGWCADSVVLFEAFITYLRR